MEIFDFISFCDETRIKKWILDKNANKFVTKRGHTPLTYAVANVHENFSKIFIESEICINIKTSCGDSPLHYASALGLQNIMILLLEYGADINALNNKDESPLCDALCFSYYAEKVSLLLDEGASLFLNDMEKILSRKTKSVTCHLKLQSFILILQKARNTLNYRSVLKFSRTFKNFCLKIKK